MSTGGSAGGLLRDTSHVDLEAAWLERNDEAKALAAAGYRSMALALRLYGLEIRLKTLVCKRLGLDYLPKHCKTHELDELLIFTGFRAALEDPSNVVIRQNWDKLARFSKESLNGLRYQPRTNMDAVKLDELFGALDDDPYGVCTWLSKLP